jgi:hypothetical protein
MSILLDKLNEDIIYSICLKSNFEDIINLSKTSKYFKEVIDKNSELIYRNLAKKDFGYKYLPQEMSYKELYQVCKTINLNGTWSIKNEMYGQNNELIEQAYKIVIKLDENNEFEYSGKMDYTNIPGIPDIFFYMKGRINKSENMRLECKITFHGKIANTDYTFGSSIFDGFISFYSYKIDKKILIHGLYTFNDYIINQNTYGITYGERISD